MTFLKTCYSETVLVTAAAGGVGLATVDLASHVLGAKVLQQIHFKLVVDKSNGASTPLNTSYRAGVWEKNPQDYWARSVSKRPEST